MSNATKESVQGKLARIESVLSEAMLLVGESAHELRQAGEDGDRIMSDTGIQVLNASEALSHAKTQIQIPA